MNKKTIVWYNLINEAESVVLECPVYEVPQNEPPKATKSRKSMRSRDIFGYLKIEYEDDSFSDLLEEYMRSKKLTSRDIYKRSYIDRKLLNKILNNPDYHPSKRTTFNLCIALQLTFDEACAFIKKANYTFSKNSKYDLIYAYVLEKEVYDIDEINELLNYFGFPCIGD